MELNVILINSLAVRISIDMMTLEQVPPVYREAVVARLVEILENKKQMVVEEEEEQSEESKEQP